MERVSVTLEELRASIGSGAVDTVLVVFPDNQGRLVGKRVTGRVLPRDRWRTGSVEACNYLLAVDVEMTPLPGYQAFNWDQGYGDFSAVPDLSTIRHGPVAGEARLWCCATWSRSTTRPSRLRCRRGRILKAD
jgi:glutamine synthetase